MPPKKDPDSLPGVKLLRLFRKLMLNGRRHFQTDLAAELECSPQTIIRLVSDISAVIGTSLDSGLENRRRWYQIKSINRSRLGLDFEELRYLSICRDLAASSLPDQVRNRVDETIFNLSMLMADADYAHREDVQKTQFHFFSKGRIDYTPHFEKIDDLGKAAEEKLVCVVSYKASGNTQSKEHRFAPGNIISMNGALYALGATLLPHTAKVRHYINFAIHRITMVAVTGQKFEIEMPEPGADAFGLPWHEPKTFRVAFTKGKASDYVRERIWADRQRIREQPDGGVVLELTTRSEPELMSWVRSFGAEARLVGSDESGQTPSTDGGRDGK
ncbi:MAG: WYL domain-containing protein [Deltaproteobacteria bacterium]|jgi:predicted DNA-binding transcriptional regulator YafY|nr:WYL domain-containing protein [Deltaproteobacteria bacterium]